MSGDDGATGLYQGRVENLDQDDKGFVLLAIIFTNVIFFNKITLVFFSRATEIFRISVEIFKKKTPTNGLGIKE